MFSIRKIINHSFGLSSLEIEKLLKLCDLVPQSIILAINKMREMTCILLRRPRTNKNKARRHFPGRKNNDRNLKQGCQISQVTQGANYPIRSFLPSTWLLSDWCFSHWKSRGTLGFARFCLGAVWSLFLCPPSHTLHNAGLMVGPHLSHI